MDNIISNVNSIYTNGTYASGTGNSLEDKINNKDLSKQQMMNSWKSAKISRVIS